MLTDINTMKQKTKKTLVVGASENPARFSYKAVRMLQEYDHEVYALGNRTGQIFGININTAWPESHDIHTVSLYVGPARQTDEFINNIIRLNPKRIIFNPGTENPHLKQRASAAGIEVVQDCTLVMLQSGLF